MNDNGKTWNHVLDYEMDDDVNEKTDKKVREYQKGSPLAKDMDEDDQENNKLQVFDSAVMDAVMAAKDMYVEDGKSLDETLDAIIDWMQKCKGKEKELMKEVESDDEDDEDEEKGD